MSDDEFGPMVVLKLCLTVFWVSFLVTLNGVDCNWIFTIFMFITSVFLVLLWFKYPYPFSIMDRPLIEEDDIEDVSRKDN